MRIVLQKVSEGLVDVVDEVSGEVDATFEPQRVGVGYVLLVGVEDEDGTKQVDWLARKIANLRVFEDEPCIISPCCVNIVAKLTIAP